jgi:hypothetical protein
MKHDPAVQSPLAWSSPTFSLESYSLLFFPGGHEKGVRQVIDSPLLHKLLASYFPETRKPSKKTVAAVCHGVLAVAEATLPDGKSVLHDATTTALPDMFEGTAFWATRLFLGDYYKTYGAGSDGVETSVSKLATVQSRSGQLRLTTTHRFENAWTTLRNSTSTMLVLARKYCLFYLHSILAEIFLLRFVREDETYNYVSARFPGDAELLAKKTVALVQQSLQS